MSDTRARLVDRLRDDHDRIIELAQWLIQIPSENPPGDTTDVCNFVTSYLESHGADYEVVAPEPSMPNVICTIEGGEPGPHLVLNGHLDVFPAGERRLWSDNPFSGTVREGKLFGRGANDMKAGTAAAILNFLYLAEIKAQLKGRLTLTLVSDEETFGPYGARHLIEQRPDVLGDVLLSGEPSTARTIRFGEKGPLWLELNVATKGGHGGYPHISANAIAVTADILRDLDELTRIEIKAPQGVLDAMEAARELLDAELGAGATDVLKHVTLNVGMIHGGVKINMIAADCRTELDFRTPVGVTTDAVIAGFEEIIGRYPGASYRVLNRAESNVCIPDHPLVGILQANAETVRGIRPLPALGLGGTDCRLWRYAGIPAYVYGPTPYNMGAPDEYVTLDDLLGTVHVHTLSSYDYLTDRSASAS
jgi:succinyl-diaminopimelate desuccinylase